MTTKTTEFASPKSIRQHQSEHTEWSARNFGVVPGWQPLMGAVEELGELAHAHLKQAQGIRGTSKEHHDAKVDAVADVIIYLMHYCSLEGIDMQSAIEVTAESVHMRDWKTYPKNGRTE